MISIDWAWSWPHSWRLIWIHTLDLIWLDALKDIMMINSKEFVHVIFTFKKVSIFIFVVFEHVKRVICITREKLIRIFFIEKRWSWCSVVKKVCSINIRCIGMIRHWIPRICLILIKSIVWLWSRLEWKWGFIFVPLTFFLLSFFICHWQLDIHQTVWSLISINGPLRPIFYRFINERIRSWGFGNICEETWYIFLYVDFLRRGGSLNGYR